MPIKIVIKVPDFKPNSDGFERRNILGAELFNTYWITANEEAITVARRLGIDVSTPPAKELIQGIVFALMTRLHRDGLLDQKRFPTKNNLPKF